MSSDFFLISGANVIQQNEKTRTDGEKNYPYQDFIFRSPLSDRANILTDRVYSAPPGFS
jgi:hypothetical protein